jgi:nitroreductase
MKIADLIKKRRSVRNYQNRKIANDKIQEIIDAARFAPSANNKQPWKVVIVREEILKQKLADFSGQNFIAEAPVILAPVATNAQKIMSNDIPGYAVDLAILTDHITLVAAEKGLGTCWIGAFDQEKVKNLLGVPEAYKIIALLPLGYPADKPIKKSRKNLNQIICFEKFQE